MQDGKFKCPYCGSTHFEHVFPKRQCLRCGKYKFWVYKSKKKKKEASNGND